MSKEKHSNLQGSGYAPPSRLVLAEVGGLSALCALVAFSAVVVKELTHGTDGVQTPPLVALANPADSSGLDAALAESFESPVDLGDMSLIADSAEPLPVMDPLVPLAPESVAVSAPDLTPAGQRDDHASEGQAAPEPEEQWPIDTRWFNGRPIRPAKTLTMVVTAYSPDSRSCGESADGVTASLHRVETNAFRLVAADSKVLPLGSMVSIPGYDSGHIVPVLDRGGAIKGNRLDVLFPTHELARQWGVRKLSVVVWQYADGKKVGNWRNVRDSK